MPARVFTGGQDDQQSTQPKVSSAALAQDGAWMIDSKGLSGRR
ncbi:hypothetical protein [Streptomyces sp. NPDC055140]